MRWYFNSVIQSKSFFHPRLNEHFGIVTVESMVAGCLLVIQSYSGPLEVIVRNGKYGLTYTQKNRTTWVTKYTLGSAKDFQHKLRNRALDFDIKHFKKKIDMLIDMTYDIENNNNKDE